MKDKILNRRTNHRLQVLTLLFLIAGFMFLFSTKVKAGTTDFAGWTAISTAEELQKLSYSNGSSKYYLTNDIDMSRYGYWNTISEFRGTLDGNGHCIKNLKSTTGGLFSNLYPGVIIRNLRLENVDILTESETGAIAARATYDDCYHDWEYIDGLVAAGAYYTIIKGEQQIYIEPIKISKCIVSGKICTGDEFDVATAGLIGADSGGEYFSYGETNDCYLVEGSLIIEECANFAAICDVGGCVGGGFLVVKILVVL